MFVAIISREKESNYLTSWVNLGSTFYQNELIVPPLIGMWIEQLLEGYTFEVEVEFGVEGC